MREVHAGTSVRDACEQMPSMHPCSRRGQLNALVWLRAEAPPGWKAVGLGPALLRACPRQPHFKRVTGSVLPPRNI